MWTRIIGYAGLIVALILVGYVVYRNTGKINQTLLFSPPQALGALWADYKLHYLDADTKRAVDPSRGNITTSEGQSYTLLRAVFQGDKETFDAAWGWSRDILQHKDDKLFSWLYGERPDGTYGILEAQNGRTSASDADTDIALALIFAFARWQDTTYLIEARAILDDLWEYEVVRVRGTYYLASNNREVTQSDPWILVNPSYYHPAAYRIFASVDPEHDWKQLADDSYVVLEKIIADPLSKEKSAYLPPDWFEVHRQTGEVRAPQAQDTTLTTNFGYDALRLPWRIALDHEWFETKASATLLKKMSFLRDDFLGSGTIKSNYAHDGEVVEYGESVAMYGGTIGYFMVADPTLAKDIYERKLAFLFNPGTNTWKERLSYYDDNLAWFGIALYNHLLPNLAKELQG